MLRYRTLLPKAGAWDFVAGTDNHQGHPTQNPGGYVGMTCFRAAELTREAVWQAMDERWTYATSGVPIVCDYAVNGIRSGAEGALAKGEKVHFSASLHGTAPIERVEIIANGQCVWQDAPNAWDVEIDGPNCQFWRARGPITICGCGSRTDTGRG